MGLGPGEREMRARARGDLRLGLPVLLAAPGQAALALAAETIRPARLAALRALGGAPVLAITHRRAETLKARAYDGDLARLILPGEAGAAWIASIADPATDLTHPLRGPFRSARQGDASLHRAAIALVKEARLLPAALLIALPGAEPEAARLAATERMTLLQGSALSSHSLAHIEEVAAAALPIALAGAARLHIFRPDDGGEEHYAIEIGEPDRSQPVLARLHSACFTGDLLGSLKCDCGPQLQAALAAMGAEGSGVLLYLNQEGRGIGLANKMRAYALQDQGFDTVEANHRLGFEDDERDFRLGAQILAALGFDKVRLLTNNPAKVARLTDCGIEVTQRVPLKAGKGAHNHAYLATKAAKSGHLL